MFDTRLNKDSLPTASGSQYRSEFTDYQLCDPRVYLAQDIEQKYARWDRIPWQEGQLEEEIIHGVNRLKSLLSQDTKHFAAKEKAEILSFLESLLERVESQAGRSA